MLRRNAARHGAIESSLTLIGHADPKIATYSDAWTPEWPLEELELCRVICRGKFLKIQSVRGSFFLPIKAECTCRSAMFSSNWNISRELTCGFGQGLEC